MRLTPDERKTALDSMPDAHYSKRMFLLSLRVAAAIEDGLSREQLRRFESELQPQVQRILTMQTKTNMRGGLALRIEQACQTFADIVGEDWRPRHDNRVARQARTELLTDI